MKEGIAPCPFVAVDDELLRRLRVVEVRPHCARRARVGERVARGAARREDRLPIRGALRRSACPRDRADVHRDVRDRLVLVFDTETVAIHVVAARERAIGAVRTGHSRCARDRVLDRVPDLARHDLRERRRGHSHLACLREGIVEIRPDCAGRTRVGERVTAAAGLDEELLAGALASLARVAACAAPGERERERSRARDRDEYDRPHGRRV